MSWYSRLRNAIRPRRLDEDLAAEMRDHMERRAADLNAKGLSEAEAQRMAALRFGNATRLSEESRETRLWAALESSLQDARYAWRGMCKSPVFALTAIVSLGLAIGANTAIYSIVDAAMLRPLPVPEPERLFTLASPGIQETASEVDDEREAFSYPMLVLFREAAGESARLALFGTGGTGTEAQGPEPGAPVEKIAMQYVSGDAFEIMRVPPAIGRVFSMEDDRVPGGHPLAVLSYEYWRRRFQGDRAIVGKSMKIGGKPYYIVGVARDGFSGMEPGKFVDAWVPSTMYSKDALSNPGWRWFRIVGRLGPGVTRERLQARLQPSFHGMQEAMVKRYRTMPPAITRQFLNAAVRVHTGETGASGFRRNFAPPLWIVLGVAAGILLIACANVASLLLARSTARSAEMAMRVSLGASKVRLVRQLLTESLLLSLLAGFLGWLLARWAGPILVGFLSTKDNPVRFALAMDTRVLFFCAAVSTLSAVCFGMLPAWQATDAQPVLALRGASAQPGKIQMGRIFVGMQVAFAFCLVIAGAGFLFSLWNLFAVDKGFDSRGVSVISVSSDLSHKPEQTQRQLMEQLQREIASQPGIQGVAAATWSIFSNSTWTDQVILPGKKPSEREEIFYQVTPGYFATLGTPLLSGRDLEFRDADAKQKTPAIVNKAFAQRYFENDMALGREFQLPSGDHYQIVGVAANASYDELRSAPKPIAYVPIKGESYFALYVRSLLDVGSVVQIVEREAKAVGSGARVREVTTLETLVGNSILKEKLLAGVGGVFALLGLLLAAIGLFGILNYSVARRTKEIGIRAALGAERGEIVRLVLSDLFLLVGVGLIAGLAGSVAVMKLVESLLFGVKAADPLVIATAAAVFLVAAAIAGGLPAMRAASVNPVVALREE
jgi:predicted permease